MTPRTGHWLLAACIALACETAPGAINEATETWATDVGYEIGGAVEGDALFSSVADVEVSVDGRQIFVLERSTDRLTVWSPEGSLLLDLGGRGDGPGEFLAARQVRLVEDGFYVRDSRRFTFFTNDGAVSKTVSFPPPSVSFRGFTIEPVLVLGEGDFLATPRIPASVSAGWMGDDPIQELPLLRVSRDPDGWGVDTVLMLDHSNRDLSIGPEDRSFAWGVHSQQPFNDSDESYFDANTGNVLILKKTLGPGAIQLVEITAGGDTVWQQQLLRPVIQFVPEVMDDFAESLAQSLISQSGSSGSALSLEDARRAVDDALYLPDYYPAADNLRPMATGEVWFDTFEKADVDTLDTWYALARGRDASALRKILLPHNFFPYAATHTHVWGIRHDMLGIQYVTGRRLRLAQSGGARE